MTPVYDQQGICVAWLDDRSILDSSGRHRALIENTAVYGYDGKYLGTFEDGYFRDRQGYAVAFVEGAAGGPLTPLPQLPPLPPFPMLAPLPPLLPIPPIPAIPRFAWSPDGWEAYLQGESGRRRLTSR